MPTSKRASASSAPKISRPGVVRIRVNGKTVWNRDEGALAPGEVARRTSQALREGEPDAGDVERKDERVRPKR